MNEYTTEKLQSNPSIILREGDVLYFDSLGPNGYSETIMSRFAGTEVCVKIGHSGEVQYEGKEYKGKILNSGMVRTNVGCWSSSICQMTVLKQTTQESGVKQVQESKSESTSMKLFLISSYTTTKPDPKTGAVTSKQIGEPQIRQVSNDTTAAMLAKTEAVYLCREDPDLDPAELTVEVRDLTSAPAARV